MIFDKSSASPFSDSGMPLNFEVNLLLLSIPIYIYVCVHTYVERNVGNNYSSSITTFIYS